MTMIMTLVIVVFVFGGIVGAVVTACCCVAGRADDMTDRARRVIEADRELGRRRQ